jgi:hypothetical protein
MSGPDEDPDDRTPPASPSEFDAFDVDVAEGGPDDVDDLPTVTCQRCDDEWDLAYELDDLRAGNRALEQFALDHERHTGHYPDDVTPWVVTCRQCPATDRFLAEHPARRWARIHARHTRHRVELGHAEADADGEGETETVGPDAE